MAEQSVVRYSLRLNLENEQHQRIQKVLVGLDKGIHKSANQFIIKAIDFYVQSFDEDDIMDMLQEKKHPEYVKMEDLADIRKEIESGLKDELIRLLGSAITGGLAVRGQVDNGEAVHKEETEENDLYAAEAANRWG